MCLSHSKVVVFGVKELGLFSWYLKEAIVGEFLCSSRRLFHSLIVEGKKKEKCWLVLAQTVLISFEFLRL